MDDNNTLREDIAQQVAILVLEGAGSEFESTAITALLEIITTIDTLHRHGLIDGATSADLDRIVWAGIHAITD